MTKENKCYSCGVDATTKEHAPPYSFFPKGYREQLVTVPSCIKHNLEASKDVEYVRNVITIHFETNKLARIHSKDKIKRSFERSPKLKTQTFQNVRPIILNGQETGVFSVDLERVKLVMSSIANAIYFNQFNKIFSGSWKTFIDSATSMELIFEGKQDGSNELRQRLKKVVLTEQKMPQPKVFRCFFNFENEHKIIYRFVFYEGFSVFLISIPFFMKYSS